MNIFPLHAADFYKTGHVFQYPENTEHVYSNFTARSARLANMSSLFDGKVVFFGLQAALQRLDAMWNEEFFAQSLGTVLGRYRRMLETALGLKGVDLQHIEELHDLGFLPLRIKALPEGARVPIGVPLLTVLNTDERFAWLTNYVETQLSAELWKSITAATIAHDYRRVLEHYADLTGADRAFIPWQGHDFSMRGMSGLHDAVATGAAHLTSFMGTDTIAAIDYLEHHYYADGFIGGSVPATEHSVMCMGGKEDEIDTFRRLVTEVYPEGIVSIVSDTWDFWKVVTEYASELKDVILAREGKVVFRPDSGDPVKIICGDPDEPLGSPAYLGALRCLWNVFGGTMNERGCRTLSPRVGLIYGDSITIKRAEAILEGMRQLGFASDNIVFGIGSYTYQHVTRDTFGFAYKSTWGQVNGEARDLVKDPVTDNGTKRSHKGLLRVEHDGEYIVRDQQTWVEEHEGELLTVYQDGDYYDETSLDEIRQRLWG